MNVPGFAAKIASANGFTNWLCPWNPSSPPLVLLPVSSESFAASEANDDGFARTWDRSLSASALVFTRMCAESTWSYWSMFFW